MSNDKLLSSEELAKRIMLMIMQNASLTGQLHSMRKNSVAGSKKAATFIVEYIDSMYPKWEGERIVWEDLERNAKMIMLRELYVYPRNKLARVEGIDDCIEGLYRLMKGIEKDIYCFNWGTGPKED